MVNHSDIVLAGIRTKIGPPQKLQYALLSMADVLLGWDRPDSVLNETFRFEIIFCPRNYSKRLENNQTSLIIRKCIPNILYVVSIKALVELNGSDEHYGPSTNATLTTLTQGLCLPNLPSYQY